MSTTPNRTPGPRRIVGMPVLLLGLAIFAALVMAATVLSGRWLLLGDDVQAAVPPAAPVNTAQALPAPPSIPSVAPTPVAAPDEQDDESPPSTRRTTTRSSEPTRSGGTPWECRATMPGDGDPFCSQFDDNATGGSSGSGSSSDTSSDDSDPYDCQEAFEQDLPSSQNPCQFKWKADGVTISSPTAASRWYLCNSSDLPWGMTPTSAQRAANC